jgi:hypothetical protein
MPRLFIDDGYTLQFTSKPTTHHEPITITYRPPVYKAVMAYDRSTVGTPEDQAAGMVELLAGHVVSWNVEDADGKPIEPKKEVFASIRDWLLLKQLAGAITESSIKAAADAKK